MVFQTSTNVYNPRVTMVRAVTWLGRFNVAAMLGGQEHCVTQVYVYTEYNIIASKKQLTCQHGFNP